MDTPPIEGLIAATFAPCAADGSLAAERVGPIVDPLVAEGISGLFVSGTTGEGASLTFEERCTIAAAYVDAAAGRLPVLIQVGRESLHEARALAEQAQSIGADGISAAAPTFFKPKDEATLAAAYAAGEQGRQFGWQAGWTTFYWAWWIAFSPVVVLFLARISKGRTAREFILGCVFAPALVCFAWMTVLGGTAIDLELAGTAVPVRPRSVIRAISRGLPAGALMPNSWPSPTPKPTWWRCRTEEG